jgi:hypothetical protein
MSEWQPIETAPKDGTFVDLWFPENGSHIVSRRIASCRWKEDLPGGPAWFAQSGGGGWNMGRKATHWMPLPSPPSPKSEMK